MGLTNYDYAGIPLEQRLEIEKQKAQLRAQGVPAHIAEQVTQQANPTPAPSFLDVFAPDFARPEEHTPDARAFGPEPDEWQATHDNIAKAAADDLLAKAAEKARTGYEERKQRASGLGYDLGKMEAPPQPPVSTPGQLAAVMPSPANPISTSDPQWREKIAAIDAQVKARVHPPSIAPHIPAPDEPGGLASLPIRGQEGSIAQGNYRAWVNPHTGLDENGNPTQYGSISIHSTGETNADWRKRMEKLNENPELAGLRSHFEAAPSAPDVNAMAAARLASAGSGGHILASPDTSLADAMRDDSRFRDMQEADQMRKDLARAQVQHAIGQAAAAGISPYALEAYKQSGEYKKALDMERLKGEYGLAQESARQQGPEHNIAVFEHEMAPIRAQYEAAKQKLLAAPPGPERDKALADAAAEYDHQEAIKKQLILRIPDPTVGIYASPVPTPGTLR